MNECTTTIRFRFLEIKKDGSLVLKINEEHKDGYYEFLICKDELREILKVKGGAKLALYEHFAYINRSFMEFLMFEMNLDSLYIASIFVNDTEQEFSYLKEKYMQNIFLSDSVSTIYGEEIGVMSDFDYYPYGLI